MTWYAVYRVLDGGLVSVGTVVAVPLPPELAAVEFPDRPEGMWDPATHTFRTRPRLRLTAQDGNGNIVTEVYALTPRDQSIPAQKRLTIRAEVVTAAGQVDATYTRTPWLLRIPHPRSGAVVVKVRVEAGILELARPDGTWLAAVPLYTNESGDLDIGVLFAGEFELVAPLMVTILLER